MTTSRRWRAALLLGVASLLAGGLVACTTSQTATSPLPTWPVPAEVLPAATSPSGDARLTCGGSTFPASGLEAPTGAEKQAGPEFDALRAALAKFGAEFPSSATWTWRLAGRDDAGAVFLAQADPAGGFAWRSIDVTTGPNGWEPSGMGDCDPHVVLSAEFGPASWALDPAFGAPTPDSTELHILVWERSCSGGAPATGRISAPDVGYTDTTVTITIGVRPLQAAPGTAFGCPMPPGTPAILRLPAPLGTRSLLDGGRVPPVAPSPPNG